MRSISAGSLSTVVCAITLPVHRTTLLVVAGRVLTETTHQVLEFIQALALDLLHHLQLWWPGSLPQRHEPFQPDASFACHPEVLDIILASHLQSLIVACLD
jgi:hypothetical protein